MVDALILETVTRMAATALLVITVALLVGRLGPQMGGLIAGVPMVVAPGYLFLMPNQSAAFIAEAAAFTIYALCGTLCFCIVFIQLVARRRGLFLSLAAAVGTWLVAASGTQALPPAPMLAAVGYVGLCWLAVTLSARVVERVPAPRPTRGWGELIVRGVAAGLLVGVAATFAHILGPIWSGLLLGFPIGLVVVSITVHRRYGPLVTVATLASAQVGMLSIVVFALTVAIAADYLPWDATFAVALAASVAWTGSMMLLQRLRYRATGS